MKMKNVSPAEISYIVTSVLLLVATVQSVVTSSELGTVGIIFFASLVVYFLAYAIRRNNKGQKENHGREE